MSDPIISATDVRVERDGSVILDEISLDITSDAEILIRGKSGAGKTTLFHVLGLLEAPTSGQLTVAGTNAADLSERQRARLRRDIVGIIFQEFQLIPDLTARENAALPQEHTGHQDDAWLDTLFERLGIEPLADQYPTTLSGGEKQRVAIARALANRPAVVLADEPTGQLDATTAEHVLDLLFDVRATADTALVVVSHDGSLTDHFPDTVQLVDGRLVNERKNPPS